MKKRTLGLALVCGFVLAGCSNEAENLQKELDSVAGAKEELVVSLNEIQAQESALQNNFDESITADEELKNFTDGSATVFTNIQERKAALEAIATALEDVQADYQDLVAFEEETLPLAKVESLTATIEELETILGNYLTAYETQLTAEEEIFQSLGAEEADFKTLYSGVQQINETSDANLETLRPLIDVFANFDTQVSELLADLAASEEE